MAEFMSLAAHEVNQPLAAMVANAGAGVRWLGREPADVAEARAAFQRIAEDGRRAGDLLRRIRAPASPSMEGESVHDVRALVDEAMSAAAELVDMDGFAIEVRAAPGEIAIRGDGAALQLALVNLIVNAIDAMGSAGTFKIVATQPQRGRVAIEVRDNGPGFSPADAERMFRPFYSTTAGAGMGLPVARAIAEAHGGTLEGECAGGATTFRLSLPTALREP